MYISLKSTITTGRYDSFLKSDFTKELNSRIYKTNLFRNFNKVQVVNCLGENEKISDNLEKASDSQLNEKSDFNLSENNFSGTSQTTKILHGIGIATNYLSKQSSQQNDQLISLLVVAHNEISKLREELSSLREENLQSKVLHQEEKQSLSKQLFDINSELQISRVKAEEKQSEKERQKERKKGRKPRPLKDPFTKEDLINVLKIIPEKYQDKTLSSRYSISICLLYLFGIRVNELRQIKIGNLKDYLEGKTLNIAVGKSKMRTKVEFPSSVGTRKFLSNFCNDSLQFCISSLSHNEDLVPVSREHLTREINNLIRNYGVTVNKHLLSLSCRVSFITRVCQTAGIEAARTMVGHAHISTTNVYNRNYLNNRARQRIMNDSLSDPKPGEMKSTPEEFKSLLEEESN